jgi:hypothetical protein
MSIENATVTGWRPVTRQDLIDLIDGGEPQKARFRDFDHQTWREQYLVGFGPYKPDSMGYFEGDISGKGKFLWDQCEIKTQVLRDPKFSDLDNGPIECMVYPDGGYERPQKGILVGMTHSPTNKRNTTGMEYTIKWLYEKDNPNASVSFRWHVMVVDKSPEPEQEKEHEVSVKLNSMIDANGVVGVAIADSAPQARYRQVDTGDKGKSVEFLDERTGSFIERTLLGFATRDVGGMLPVDQDGCVCVYARIRR